MEVRSSERVENTKLVRWKEWRQVQYYYGALDPQVAQNIGIQVSRPKVAWCL